MNRDFLHGLLAAIRPFAEYGERIPMLVGNDDVVRSWDGCDIRVRDFRRAMAAYAALRAAADELRPND